MEKTRWQDFLAARLRSQISMEHAERAQVWGLLGLALISFAFAFSVVSSPESRVSFLNTQILFLWLSHAGILGGAFIPSLLQKGEKTLCRILGVRDFTSLTFVSLAAAVTSAILLTVSWQVAAGQKDITPSAFFNLIAWANVLFSGTYLTGFLFYTLGFLTAPGAVVKAAEKGTRVSYGFAGLHAAFLVLWFIAYGESGVIGSPSFFDEARLALSFGIGLSACVLFAGKLLKPSSAKKISFLELEVVSGKIDRNEDILSRFKDTFVSQRLASWLSRISHKVATQAHEIAQYTHDAMALVARDKPTELDLRQVEDRYRRADAIFRKLEKEDQRFMVSAALFDVNDVERERIELLKDLFSRELRHAKLELASVRKHIDDKLVALKNTHPQPAPVTTVPVEKIPVSR